jgi:N6-adenosine-specific RNA methylase IME4
MTRYRTIVADPPWPLKGAGPKWTGRKGIDARGVGPSRPLPYKTMTVPEIAALPVGDLAEPDAHLYLWTMNAFMVDTYTVAQAWGFRPAQLLTWAKTPRGLGLGGAFTSTTEFVLFCRRGMLPATSRVESTWWNWKRPEDGTGPAHSRKPEGFIDLVEQVSPGPYVELFARRARFGWDYWGDQSLGTAEMAA